MTINSIAIIPARMGSSRFPGKPLKKICGMEMIGHCYWRAILSNKIDDVYVATCDKEIQTYIESIGGKVIMTKTSHKRASTRTEEALSIILNNGIKEPNVIVMIQGDEPLIRPSSLSSLVNMFDCRSIEIGNLIAPIKEQRAFEDKNNVKVVFDKNMEALYFSREPIPSNWLNGSLNKRFMQVGVIAFTAKSLSLFNSLNESFLEIEESVDMNRILENKGKIKLEEIEYQTIGVDTDLDLLSAQKIMTQDNIKEKYLLKA